MPRSQERPPPAVAAWPDWPRVDHRPRRPEPVHGVIAIDRAAAGGDDRTAQIDGQQYFLLEFPQPQVAVAFQQLLQGGPARTWISRSVSTKRRPLGLARHYTHGALAGAGHADQADGVCAAVGKSPGLYPVSRRRGDYPVSAPAKALSATHFRVFALRLFPQLVRVASGSMLPLPAED